MAHKKINRLTMDELIVNVKNALKGKTLEPNNKDKFENAIKKAVIIKQRGSK